MSISDTYSIGVSGTDSTRGSGSSMETGTTRVSVDVNLPAGSVDYAVAAAFIVANTQALFLVSSANCTIKTNSSGTPGNTINLVAGIPMIWRKSAGYYPNPFTVDVTSLLVSSTASTRLQGSILTT